MANNWAVVVGINRYRTLRRLQNAVADAVAVRKILISDFGFDERRIRLVLDRGATRANLLRLINVTIPTRWNVGRDDQLFFFFAGHAGRARRNRKRSWFLSVVDSKKISSGVSAWDSVLTRDDLRTIEQTFKGKHIFYVFDCCYSGLVFSREGQTTGPLAEKSVFALVAGRGGDPVSDGGGVGHSIFTESLLEGLGGWGGLNADDNGIFLASDLIAFIRTDVARQIRNRGLKPQKPFGGPLVGNPDGTEFSLQPVVPRIPRDIVLALANGNASIKRVAVGQLSALEEPAIRSPKILALRRMSRDSSPSVRQEVVMALTRVGRKDTWNVIVQLAKDEDQAVAISAVRALGELRRDDVDALRTLKNLKGLPSIGDRLVRAIESSLALLGDKGAVRRVIGDLPNEEGSIRREVIDLLRQLTLRSLSKEELGDILLARLANSEWRTRRAACEAVGELGIALGEPRLRRLMSTSTEHFMVRYSAAEALGHLGRPNSRDALCSALTSDGSLLVRSAAAEALGVVGGNSALVTLTSALARDPEWRVRRASAESCGMLSDASATRRLALGVHDPHFRVRLAVVAALGEIADPDSTAVLTEVEQTDLSLHVRRAAEHALQHLQFTK